MTNRGAGLLRIIRAGNGRLQDTQGMPTDIGQFQGSP